MNEFPVARFYRDAKVWRSAKAHQVQRMVIARRSGLGGEADANPYGGELRVTVLSRDPCRSMGCGSPRGESPNYHDSARRRALASSGPRSQGPGLTWCAD
jgi:hypothetical protein